MATINLQLGADLSRGVAQWGLNWLVQSILLTAVGLILAGAFRRWGAATQSAIYRTTLVAVLLAPVATVLVGRLGFGRVSIPLSAVGIATPDANWSQSPGVDDQHARDFSLAGAAPGAIKSASTVPDSGVAGTGARIVAANGAGGPTWGGWPGIVAACGLSWMMVSAVYLVRLGRSCWTLHSLSLGSSEVE